MIELSKKVVIADNEIDISAVRSQGTGGQNVNKVSTAVQLRFDAARSPSLPEDVRRRLLGLAGRRLSGAGVLIIEARRFRTQERNRQDALDRLCALIRKAAQPVRRRRPTRPTKAAKKARLEEKRKRGQLKESRKRIRGSNSS